MSIRIRSHWSVVLTPLVFLPVAMRGGTGIREALWEAVLITLLIQFFAILPHEFGHVITSRLFGLRRGTLFIGGIFGGWLPDDDNGFDRLTPGRRMLLFAAGSAINLLVAVLSVIFRKASIHWHLHVSWLCSAIMEINLFMALLNLLPIFPLDGGRIIREFFVILGLRPSQNFTCMRLSSTIFGLGWLLWILRYGYLTDYFFWFLVMTLAIYLLLDRTWYMEGLGIIPVRRNWRR